MYENYGLSWLIHGGIAAVFALAIGAVGIVTCVRGRRHADPARLSMSWLKLAFILSFLNLILSAASSIITGVMMLSYSGSSPGYTDNLQRISNDIGVASGVTYSLSAVAFIMTCVEMGLGFMYALDRQRTKPQKMIRILALIGVVILAILTIAHAGIYGSLLNDIYDLTTPFETLRGRMSHTTRLSTAKSVITLVLNIAILFQAAIVKHKYRAIQTCRQTVTLYLVATILILIRQIWNLIYGSVVNYTQDSQLGYPSASVPTDIILNMVPWLIALVLLFCVAIRRHNGLWTTPQPWMSGVDPALATSQPQQAWYGQQLQQQQQQMMYNPVPMYPPPGPVMYQQQQPHPQQLGPNMDPYELHTNSAPSEVPGEEVAHMAPGGQHYYPAGQNHVVHEMK